MGGITYELLSKTKGLKRGSRLKAGNRSKNSWHTADAVQQI